MRLLDIPELDELTLQSFKKAFPRKNVKTDEINSIWETFDWTEKLN